MQEVTTYCDICGDKSTDTYGIDVKWCNENNYRRFDICKSCKDKGEELIIPQPLVIREKHKLLGLLKLLFNKLL